MPLIAQKNLIYLRSHFHKLSQPLAKFCITQLCHLATFLKGLFNGMSHFDK